jgi:putative DNA primase/helicase
MPALRENAGSFDCRDDELNVRNGTLTLKSGQLHRHDRSAMHSKLANVDHDSDAGCPRFLKFLDETFGGDAELIAYVQRVAGYCLTGSIEEQLFFLLFGNGANGKSTFVRILFDLLGDYIVQLPTETLLKQQSRSQTSDLARLDGARVAVANELPEGRKLDEALIKQLTGGERVTARLLYKDFVEIQPKCKVLISSNYLPEITGTDLGIWRRVHVIPFAQTVPAERMDPQLNAKLREELPGILNWAVAGCLDWRKQGLNPPGSVTEAVQAFRSEMDSVGSFIDEACVLSKKARTASSVLFDEYQDWCEQSGAHPVFKSQFLSALRQRGLQEWRSGRARGFRGIEVRTIGVRRQAA